MTVGKIVHAYEITCEGQKLVEATVTLVVIDSDGNPQRVSEDLLEFYGQD